MRISCRHILLLLGPCGLKTYAAQLLAHHVVATDTRGRGGHDENVTPYKSLVVELLAAMRVASSSFLVEGAAERTHHLARKNGADVPMTHTISEVLTDFENVYYVLDAPAPTGNSRVAYSLGIWKDDWAVCATSSDCTLLRWKTSLFVASPRSDMTKKPPTLSASS